MKAFSWRTRTEPLWLNQRSIHSSLIALASIILLNGFFANIDAYAKDAMPVSVVRIIRAPIAEELRLSGTLMARRISRLSSEVDGIVAAIVVDDGDVVKKGQLLVRLEEELAEIDATSAVAVVAEARARASEAERRYEELLALSKKQHVAQTSVESTRAEIDIEKAALARTNAALARSQALLRRHTIVAPFDGLVRRKLVEVGQWVDTSSPLVELVETSHLRLEAPVPQFYFSRVRPGTPVAIRFDSLPNEILEAKVTTRIPVSDAGTRTFPIRIDLANESGLLAPGMSARIVMQIEDVKNPTALLVPRDAIVRKPDGSTAVWTIEVEDGIEKAAPKTITTGRIYRNNIEVLESEISAGDLVIVRGNEILRPGQAVVVAAETAMDI